MEGEESRNGRFTRQLNNPQCMYLLTDLSGQDTTPLGTEYVTHDIDPSDIALVPILRSGLGMIEGIPHLPHTLSPTNSVTQYLIIYKTNNGNNQR